MQSNHVIWATIIGYMLLASFISLLTSFWIRHHLRRQIVYPHCLLSDRPMIYPTCLLKDKPKL